MDTSRKREREQKEESSKKKGKKPMKEDSKAEKVTKEQDQDKGKKPMKENLNLGKSSIYDDLMEDSSEVVMSTEKGRCIFCPEVI